MQEGIRNMFKKKEDFECHPNGECWCKEEKFPIIPDEYPKDECLSPEAIEQLRVEQDLVDEMEKPNV
tara:strand:+ start:222 stop:422 length:201 start_codon:yes stop_codon:yes gene_type:complete